MKTILIKFAVLLLALNLSGCRNENNPAQPESPMETTVISEQAQGDETMYHQEKDMKAYLHEFGTVQEAWFPLGGRDNVRTRLRDRIISDIAKAHEKTLS